MRVRVRVRVRIRVRVRVRVRANPKQLRLPPPHRGIARVLPEGGGRGGGCGELCCVPG